MDVISAASCESELARGYDTSLRSQISEEVMTSMIIDIRPDKATAFVDFSAVPVHSFDNYLIFHKTYTQAPTPSVPGLEGTCTASLSCSAAFSL